MSNREEPTLLDQVRPVFELNRELGVLAFTIGAPPFEAILWSSMRKDLPAANDSDSEAV